MDPTSVSTNTWTDEENTEMLEYRPAIKINGIVLSFLAMSLKDAMLNEISQAQEDNPHSLGLVCCCCCCCYDDDQLSSLSFKWFHL